MGTKVASGNLKEGIIINNGGKTRPLFTETTYTWVVENFSYFKLRPTGYNIISPTITAYSHNLKYEWHLVLYPTGINSSFNHSLSLFLKQISCSQVEKSAHVTLSIIGNVGVEINVNEKFQSIYNMQLISYYSFAKISDVYEHALLDDNLMIKCRIRIDEGISHTTNLNTDSDNTLAMSRMAILDDLEGLLESSKLSDVKLVVNGKQFSAHKSILAARSRVFAAMFEHDMRESRMNIVEIKDIDSKVMAEILRFIYTGQAKNIEELAADLLVAADKYDLEALKIMCGDVLVAKLSLENLGEVLKIVDRYEISKMRESAMKFLSNHGKQIAEMKDFDAIMKSLSSSLLIEVTKVLMQRS